MKHLKKIFLLLTLVLFSVLFSCSTTGDIWRANGRYVFYSDSRYDYTSSESLSVFVDWNGSFNIYDAIVKEHVKTRSPRIFLNTLSKLISENYRENISVLTLCSGYQEYTRISEMLSDATLVRTISIQSEGDECFYTVMPFENASQPLTFRFSPELMTCVCRGN